MQKPQCGVHWLFDCFSVFVNIFLCYFFQKQNSKDHLTQGKLLKTMLLNENHSNLEKDMYGNISLYCQYFSPGIESNANKTYFYFIKQHKSILFCLLRSKHIHVT